MKKFRNPTLAALALVASLACAAGARACGVQIQSSAVLFAQPVVAVPGYAVAVAVAAPCPTVVQSAVAETPAVAVAPSCGFGGFGGFGGYGVGFGGFGGYGVGFGGFGGYGVGGFGAGRVRSFGAFAGVGRVRAFGGRRAVVRSRTVTRTRVR